MANEQIARCAEKKTKKSQRKKMTKEHLQKHLKFDSSLKEYAQDRAG